ncbi:MAG: Terminase RNaseH-like domain [Alphaproteobacteria bacterium]|jgi:phage terminase large subunit-like protein|nr:Terminase RNaseH-like domain [Alphaproteobacteria bacterium]
MSKITYEVVEHGGESGISAAQELRNRYATHSWPIQTCPVRGDKVARAHAVQPLFSQGLIYTPARDWAE